MYIFRLNLKGSKAANFFMSKLGVSKGISGRTTKELP